MTEICKECDHDNVMHKIRSFASGRKDCICKETDCNCKVDLTPKVYIVKSLDRRTNKIQWHGDYDNEEEAAEKLDYLIDLCESIWCENHKQWIEVV
jgi:hypothetical protein